MARWRNTRTLAVHRLQHQLQRHSFPRLQMALIVALTGATGLLGSYLLLRWGVHAMVLRYPLALLGAYGAFLALLWLWLHSRAADYANVPDLVAQLPGLRQGGDQAPAWACGGGGGGGDFAGGGATAAWVDGAEAEPLAQVGKGGLGQTAGAALDLDEASVPLVLLALMLGLALGLVLASLYVVYLAPALFAELLFDGVLSYSLYRHLRRGDEGHWLGTALRRTAWPFGLTAVLLVVMGAAMTAYAPGAHSVGEVFQQARARR